MRINKPRLSDITRLLAYLYFIVLLVFSVYEDTSLNIFARWETFIVIILINQMVFRWNIADLIIGMGLSTIFIYILTGIVISHVNYNSEEPNMLQETGFLLPYIFFGSILIAALAIMYAFYAKRRRLRNKKEAMQNANAS